MQRTKNILQPPKENPTHSLQPQHTSLPPPNPARSTPTLHKNPKKVIILYFIFGFQNLKKGMKGTLLKISHFWNQKGKMIVYFNFFFLELKKKCWEKKPLCVSVHCFTFSTEAKAVQTGEWSSWVCWKRRPGATWAETVAEKSQVWLRGQNKWSKFI